jgi:hypothetical protein
VNDKFRVLRVLALIFKVVAWLTLISGIIGFFIFLAMGSLTGKGPVFGAAWAFGSLVYGIVLFISLYAWAEIIYVLLSIENSARTVARKLSEE